MYGIVPVCGQATRNNWGYSVVDKKSHAISITGNWRSRTA
jgi:hypothetical protein